MVWLGFPLTGRRPTGVLRFGGQRGHRRSGAQMAERELQVMSRELCFYASLCRRWPMLARVCFDVHCDRFFLFSGCSRILMTSQKYAESLPTQVRVSFLSFFFLFLSAHVLLHLSRLSFSALCVCIVPALRLACGTMRNRRWRVFRTRVLWTLRALLAK